MGLGMGRGALIGCVIGWTSRPWVMYSLGLTLRKSGLNSLPRKGKFNDYKFRWLNCDGSMVFRSLLSDLLALILLRTHFSGLNTSKCSGMLTAEMVHISSQAIELFPWFIPQNGTIRLPGNDQVEDDNLAKRDESDLKKECKSGGKYASKRAGR
ncbi:hypothetical protein B0H14DRAFT_2581469 [Mycena olivaceomarginata]|nr:hypothetical protein B0H14DRAFT_2581469 [Mycena olivaceomarginata]